MAALPAGTKLYLRGSAVQGESYVSHQPFDAGGPGSSDLDVVVCGTEVMALFADDGFYVPGINSRPLGDTDRDVAPLLDDARARAQELAGWLCLGVLAARSGEGPQPGAAPSR